MQEYLEIVSRSPLFRGMTTKETETMLSCLTPAVKQFGKGEFILQAGQKLSSMGMVLSGSAYIIREDFWGNRDILAVIGAGQLFAEAFACRPQEVLSVSVLTGGEPATVLFMDVDRVMTTCSSSCRFHTRLIRNLLETLAEKNLLLNEKLGHVTQRNTREKLLSYLSAEARKQGGNTFTIPFDRQQLADYLAVDRSAMSKELGKMRDEGLVTFQRSRFVLHERWEEAD